MAKPGRYRILRKIADGGMAEIFLATQRGAEGFERPVVLKRILAALVADPQFRNMMIDEAHVAMSLNHSNIVQVLDLGHAKGRYFLVLEFVDGWDLNHLLNRVRAQGLSVPPELALYVSAEVCRALSYAHSRARDGKAMGIVHRDVSPHNVLVSEHGEVKLTDFGIAKALGRRERTGQGVIKGKLAFMSPEQASGLTLDARSDLFSVGTMMYLMVTGRKPFEAPTDLEAILRVRQCDFPQPSAIKPDISPKLADIILRAMKQDPADRYQTAEEMLIDIEQVQRTVFQPAGQTELKRWLSDLQQKDGIAPIGRAPGPANTETDADLLELVDGEELVFEDSKVESVDSVLDEATIAGRHRPPTAPTMAAATKPGPIPALPPPTPRGQTATPTPTPVRRPRRGFSAFLLLAGTGLGAWVYFKLRGDEPVGTAPADPRPAPEPAAPTVAPPSPTATAPKDATLAGPDGESAVAETVAPAPDGSAADPAPTVATGPDAATEEEDDEGAEEEALLKTAEPAQEAVLDEEDSAPTPPRVKPAAPSRAPSVRNAQISVRLVTRPEGALVQLKGKQRTRNFDGRTPMSLRFKPGNYYDLAFVKRGYVTATKRIYVAQKTRSVSVSLKKKRPTKRRKSILQRIFGR